MKPSYILNVTYPMATVIAKIHRPAVAMSAPRSMFLVVCDIGLSYCYMFGFRSYLVSSYVSTAFLLV
jgi:hypothetical protein